VSRTFSTSQHFIVQHALSNVILTPRNYIDITNSWSWPLPTIFKPFLFRIFVSNIWKRRIKLQILFPSTTNRNKCLFYSFVHDLFAVKYFSPATKFNLGELKIQVRNVARLQMIYKRVGKTSSLLPEVNSDIAHYQGTVSTQLFPITERPLLTTGS
jgi:hypothetical protein